MTASSATTLWQQVSVNRERLSRWLQERFELSRGDVDGNVRPMEGLRGLAIFLVFLGHYVTSIDPWMAKQTATHSFAIGLHTIGSVGVDLFFVLSGYLIYGSLISRRQPFFRFMARRVERIYPAFIVVYLTYVALSFVFPSERKIPPGVGDALVYLLQNFFLLPGMLPIQAMNTVAWSLSYEMFYYLTIPLVITLFGLHGRSVAFRVAFFASLSLAGFVFFGFFGGPVRLLMFLSGVLLYETMKHKLIGPPPAVVGLLALIASFYVMLVPIGILKVVVLYVGFFVLCLVCFSRTKSLLARFFSLLPIRWLGNMSYSYYLIHGLGLKASFLVLAAVFTPTGQEGLPFFVALLPVMFVLTLCPSGLLFLIIERPFSLKPKRHRPAAHAIAVDGTAR
jgi:exopolysaccharide production protein ExoZ